MSEAGRSDRSETALPAGAACAAHDESASFVCDRCGDFGCVSCLFFVGARRSVCVTCAEKGLGQPIPWERRKELGNVQSFWQTTKLCMASPTRFFCTPTTQESSIGAIAYGVVAVTIGLFLTYVIAGLALLVGGGALAAILDAEYQGIFAVVAGYGCAFLGLSPWFALAAGPMNALLGQVVAAACAHGTLVLMKRSRAGFEETLRVCSYANAPYLFSFVPLAGSLSWFWVVGIEVVGLREVHGCGTDRAAFAALAYRVAFLVTIVGGYAAFFLILTASLPPLPE